MQLKNQISIYYLQIKIIKNSFLILFLSFFFLRNISLSALFLLCVSFICLLVLLSSCVGLHFLPKFFRHFLQSLRYKNSLSWIICEFYLLVFSQKYPVLSVPLLLCEFLICCHLILLCNPINYLRWFGFYH